MTWWWVWLSAGVVIGVAGCFVAIAAALPKGPVRFK